MANLGEKQLTMEVENGDGEGIVQSVFQIAQVTRPLMSVGKVCDGGAEILFTSTEAAVRKNGKTICTFKRTNGGLYLAKMKLKSPKSSFPRQG